MPETQMDGGRGNPKRSRGYGAGCLWALFLMLTLPACSVSYDTTKTARSPIEQLLLGEALQRGLGDAVLPLRQDQIVAVEASGLTGDQAFVATVVEEWLRRAGVRVPKDGKEPVLARVMLDAFGTLQNQSFVGIPAISSTIIPFALPELAFFKAVRQQGYSRLSIRFIDKGSGRLISSTSVLEGVAYYNQYTVMLVFTFTRSDLVPTPPED